MKKTILKSSLTLTAAALVQSPGAHAIDNIINSYLNPRIGGMGGMKLTTGLYEENFTGNPARVTANPKWKVQLADIAANVKTEGLSTLSEAAAGGIDGLMDTAGEQSHFRVSPTLLGVYLPFENMSYAFGIQGSVQSDFGLSNSYRIDSQVIADIGPSLTVGRKFLENKELSVGMTAHYKYRISGPEIVFSDFLTTGATNLLGNAGEGSKFDLDLGATYVLPWQPDEVQFITAATLSNALGMDYGAGLGIVGSAGNVPTAGRTLGLGVAAFKETTGFLSRTTLGLEVQNIGNNGEGSVFRMLHIGGETHWKRLALRLGVNQGYLCAGLGVDLWALQLDVATQGEEMTLNAGGRENRTLAVRLGLQI
jgi:hypothetical protein